MQQTTFKKADVIFRICFLLALNKYLITRIDESILFVLCAKHQFDFYKGTEAHQRRHVDEKMAAFHY